MLCQPLKSCKKSMLRDLIGLNDPAVFFPAVSSLVSFQIRAPVSPRSRSAKSALVPFRRQVHAVPLRSHQRWDQLDEHVDAALPSWMGLARPAPQLQRSENRTETPRHAFGRSSTQRAAFVRVWSPRRRSEREGGTSPGSLDRFMARFHWCFFLVTVVLIHPESRLKDFDRLDGLKITYLIHLQGPRRERASLCTWGVTSRSVGLGFNNW